MKPQPPKPSLWKAHMHLRKAMQIVRAYQKDKALIGDSKLLKNLSYLDHRFQKSQRIIANLRNRLRK